MNAYLLLEFMARTMEVDFAIPLFSLFGENFFWVLAVDVIGWLG